MAGAAWNSRSSISTGRVRSPCNNMEIFSNKCGFSVNGASPSSNADRMSNEKGILSRNTRIKIN